MKNLIRESIKDYYRLKMFCPEHELLRYLIIEGNNVRPDDDFLIEFLKRFGPNFDKFFNEENRENPNFDLFIAVTFKKYFNALEKELSPFDGISLN